MLLLYLLLSIKLWNNRWCCNETPPTSRQNLEFFAWFHPGNQQSCFPENSVMQYTIYTPSTPNAIQNFAKHTPAGLLLMRAFHMHTLRINECGTDRKPTLLISSIVPVNHKDLIKSVVAFPYNICYSNKSYLLFITIFRLILYLLKHLILPHVFNGHCNFIENAKNKLIPGTKLSVDSINVF